MRYRVYLGISGHGYPGSWIDCHEIEASNEADVIRQAKKMKLDFYVGMCNTERFMCNTERLKPYHTLYYDFVAETGEIPTYADMEIALREYIDNEIIYEIEPIE